MGRRSGSEQQRRISPRRLGADGLEQDNDEGETVVVQIVQPPRRRTIDNPMNARIETADPGRPIRFNTTTRNAERGSAQPLDIPGARFGRRNAIPGPTLPFANDDDIPVGGPPRSPGIIERTATPVTAGILRAQRHGLPPRLEQRRHDVLPAPGTARWIQVVRAAAQFHEATRRVSQSATIEPGDVAPEESVDSTSEVRPSQSTAIEPGEVAPNESADSTSESRSRTGNSPDPEPGTNDATTEQLLAAVLSSPRPQDPEVRMVLHVPDPRIQASRAEEREARGVQEAQAIPASQARQRTVTDSGRLSRDTGVDDKTEMAEDQRPLTIHPSTPRRFEDKDGGQLEGGSIEEATPKPAVTVRNALKNGGPQPQTSEATRDRRHMRALITNATQRRLRAATESHNSPSPIRPFVRSNSPSPPSPTPRPRRKSWPSRAEDTPGTPMTRADLGTGTGPGVGQVGYIDEEEADRYLELGD